jgi:hypothetical protein
VVCSGIFKVPFGPECLAAGQFRPSGAVTMKDLKNVAGSQTCLRTHNTEDARVIVQTAPQQPSQRKWVKLKAVAKPVAKFILYRSAIWVWDHSGSIWDWLCSNVGPFL